MTIRRSLLVGLLILVALGTLQGGAALFGSLRQQQAMARQTERLIALNHTASAQLAFERADRAAEASRHAASPARRRELADLFRAEIAETRTALTAASQLEPGLQKTLDRVSDWSRHSDPRLPGSVAGPQTSLLRDDLLSDFRDAGRSDLAGAAKQMLQGADLVRAKALQEADQARVIVVCLVSASLAGACWLAVLLVRRVLRPLAALTVTTHRLASGQLDRSVLGTSRTDEIGAVATALEALRLGTLHAKEVEVAAARERDAADARIRHLAHHDPLTGLANRAKFGEQLELRIALARQTGQQFALLWIDLDHFKTVNDSRGHAAGDELLREVAHRLVSVVRETDLVARVGGDEFVIIQDSGIQPHAADALATRILGSLAKVYDLSREQASVTASIGIAIVPDDGSDASTIQANADLAMYRIKHEGRNGHAFFQPEMDEEVQIRQRLEQDLQLAQQRGQLSLVYQPQVDVRDGTPVGFEALLRWRHPERGEISPGLFIPVAEASGSIVPIGAWVLRQVCREAAGWANPLRVAVNVSPVQFQRCDIPRLVEEALSSSGLLPERLEIEVTEGVMIHDIAATMLSLRRIRSLGVSVALDDFGTGYSSLSTLRAFPFNRLKVDRSFVKDLATSTEAGAIVRAVLGLAEGLALPVVAEGVENEAQLAILKEANCAEAQGYLLGKPMPIGSYTELTSAIGARQLVGC